MPIRALFSVLVLLPLLTAVPALGQTDAPSAGEPDEQLITAQRVISPGGIEAWLVEDHSIPVIALEAGFKGGSSVDPQALPGLANMTAALLDEGAGDMDSLAFRQQLENLAIGLSFSASQDAFTASLRTIAEHRDTAFDMLRLALTEPRFDNEPVSRVRSQIQTNLAMDLQRPNTVAGRRWAELMFGDHPYGSPTRGTPESVAAITVEDMRGYVTDRLGRDRLKIGVAGAITPEELGPLLDSTLGGLPATSTAPDVADVTPRAAGTVVVVKKDVPQSVAIFGHVGIDRHDDDFYPAFVVNHVLGGGGFTARLMDEVREKRGLAYGVSSGLSPREHADVIVGSVGTANERLRESLNIIRAEWRRMAENGPTAEELADAKTYLTGAWPLRFTSTASVAGILASMQLDGYPMDHLHTRNDKVEAVTLDDARRVAARLLDADALTVVVVGKPVGLDDARWEDAP